MRPLDQLDQILPAVLDVARGIEPDQLDDPTPCAAFSVHDVLDHMIVGGSSFAYAFRGETPPAIRAPEVDGRVPVEELESAMSALRDAAGSPGVAERIVTAPFGQVPGETFAAFVAFDGLIHGWDLATATGQQYAPDQSVVAAVDAFARRALTAEMRDGDTFAAEITPPDDASRLERLVAFSGRRL